VQGLVLLNPWVRSEQSLARTHVKHYYRQRLMQREFWVKLFSGKVAATALQDLFSSMSTARGERGSTAANGDDPCYRTRMALAWRRFDGPVLLVLSGQDYTAKEFMEYASTDRAWHGVCDGPAVEKLDLEAAEHTFARDDDRVAVERATLGWLKRQPPDNRRRPHQRGGC